jgi:hypothetical protein
MKLTLLLTFLLLVGCATIECQGIKYTRFGSQNLHGVKLFMHPNGLLEFQLDRQKSDLEVLSEALGVPGGWAPVPPGGGGLPMPQFPF